MIAPTMQPWALCFLLLCSVAVPAEATELTAIVLVGMLASASTGAGVPAWPHVQLRAEDAKMILDVEKMRMLAWQTWAAEQTAGCPSKRLEQRYLRGGGRAPEGSVNLWLRPLLVLIPVVFGFQIHLIKSRNCFRQSGQGSSLAVGRPETSYGTCSVRPHVLPTLLPTAARTQGVQQAASCPENAGVAAAQVQTELAQGKHFWQNCAGVPAWQFDSATVPWSQGRRNARSMSQHQSSVQSSFHLFHHSTFDWLCLDPYFLTSPHDRFLRILTILAKHQA